MKIAYIGLDVGTSSCKANVIDTEGNILASARREYGFVYPGPDMVELDPAVVWNNVCEVLAEIANIGNDVEIRLLAVSSIGEAMVMIDKAGNVLRNGITYLDQRGPETVPYIRSVMKDDILLGKTGIPLNLTRTLSRYIWLMDNQPDILEKTDHYFLFAEYISYKLTGQRMVDYSSASTSMLFNIRDMEWDREIGESFGIPLDKFSKVAQTGTVIGEILPEISEKMGLPKSLRVVLGSHDQAGALLGSGGVKAGDIMLGEGSTESINLLVNRAEADSILEKNIYLEPYVQDDQYFVPTSNLIHGNCIRWFLREFWPEVAQKAQKMGMNVYDLADKLCAADSDELFFLPYLAKTNVSDYNSKALGGFIGMKIDTTGEQAYRALLEGLCFESRINFDFLDRMHFSYNNIIATGGCSYSDLYMQMKADILKQPVYVLKNRDAGTAALAMVCSVADGFYSNYDEAAKAFVKIEKEFVPRNDYEEKYQKYQIVSKTIKQLYEQI